MSHNGLAGVFDFRNLLFLCVAAIVMVALAHEALIRGHWGANDYMIGEWAINYSTGFVRRGLGGTVLLWLQSTFGIGVRTAVAVGGYAAYAVVAGYYCYHVFRARDVLHRHVLVIFLFLPASILMPMLDPAMMGRKDFLFLMLLIAHIAIINVYTDRTLALKAGEIDARQSLLRRYVLTVAVVYNVAGVPAALLHEGIVWLSVPVNVALTFLLVFQAKRCIRTAAVTAIAVYTPTILVAMVVVTATLFDPVSQVRAMGICQPFDNIADIDCSRRLPSAIQVLSFAVTDAGHLVVKYVLSSVTVTVGWITLISLNVLLALYAGVEGARVRVRHANTKFYRDPGPADRRTMFHALVFPTLLFPLACAVTLIPVGQDLGRWTFVTVVSFLLCAAASRHILLFTGAGSANEDDAGGALLREPKPVRPESTARNTILYSAMLFASFYAVSSTTLPHCCMRHDQVIDQYLSTGVVRHVVLWAHNLGLYVTGEPAPAGESRRR